MWCVYLHGEYISTRAFLARVVVFLFVSRVLNSYEVAVADHHQPYSRVADDSVRDQLVDFLGFTSAFVFLELVYIFRICIPKKCTHAYDVLCMVSGGGGGGEWWGGDMVGAHLFPYTFDFYVLGAEVFIFSPIP